MTKIVKNVSIMCFHEELCQVYNALMTALISLPASRRKSVLISLLPCDSRNS